MSGVNTIEKISFLHEDRRMVVDVEKDGTFRVPVTEVVAGRVKTSYKNLTARQIIEHPSIKGADPVLTLKTGEKLRVFDGGDCKYLPAMSDGVIAKHDSLIELKKKRSSEEENNAIKKKFKSNKTFLSKLKNNKNNNSSKTIVPPPPPPLASPTDTVDEDGEFEYPWDNDYDYYD